MPKEVKAYQCNFCQTTYLQTQLAIEQENICLYNPSFMCCDNCTHNKEMDRPKFENQQQKVQVCQNPFSEENKFEIPHEYGWCPNYIRDKRFEVIL